MLFHVSHQTQYHYEYPAADSFAELRVCPQDGPGQKVLNRSLKIDPIVPVESYTDYFGNRVEFFSVPFRHQRLSVHSWAEVETTPVPMPEMALDVPVAEALQIYRGQMLEIFDFLQPSHHVPLGKILDSIHKNFFRSGRSLRDCLLELNQWIYTTFKYTQGATDISTPLSEVIATQKGVCQDFAHLMLCILRSSGIPARYVSGYIEASDPTKKKSTLVGAAASHAWVEALLPGMNWWGLDPTNNQPSGERHVRVAVGRDYRDVAPLRGTYLGAQHQELEVIVSMERRTAPDKKAPSAVR